jgi:predicted DNA-binding transcriptional regulator YafY
MSEIDRLYRYRSLFTSRHAVPTQELMDTLGISIATLKRDLSKLRDRLNLQVEYDRMEGGYRLAPGHGSRELPGLWMNSQELVALATLQHLLANFVPGLMADKLAPLKQLLARLLHDADLDNAALAQRIRLVQAGQRHLPPAAFEAVALATLTRRQLHLRHFNRENAQTTERTVSPQQLVRYRDNWYLDAWCHWRHALRSFAVDAIEHCEVLPDIQAIDVPPEELHAATQSTYGIFNGPARDWAVLRFSPERARWVSGETWHPEQRAEWLPDGSYRLRVPYGDDRELVGDILRHGPSCVVEAPPQLRAVVRAALLNAVEKYADATP